MSRRTAIQLTTAIASLALISLAGIRWGLPTYQRFVLRTQTALAERALLAAARSDSGALAALSDSGIPPLLFPSDSARRAVFQAAAASGRLRLTNGFRRGDSSVATWRFPFVPDWPSSCGPQLLQASFVRNRGEWRLRHMGIVPC